MRNFFLILLVLHLPCQVLAVEPSERLADPALEARARALSQNLRCLVCRNESIDDSNAELAKDLRLLVRERLLAGDQDPEVLQFLVDRYGEYVLLKPRFSTQNALLWGAPVLFLLFGCLCAGIFLRRRYQGKTIPEIQAPLNEEEKQRLEKLLGM